MPSYEEQAVEQVRLMGAVTKPEIMQAHAAAAQALATLALRESIDQALTLALLGSEKKETTG